MADVLDRLLNEVAKARFNKDTQLKSRLHEAIREIEYLRWSIYMLASIDDDDKPRLMNEFARLTKDGERIGPAHHIAQKSRSGSANHDN